MKSRYPITVELLELEERFRAALFQLIIKCGLVLIGLMFIILDRMI